MPATTPRRRATSSARAPWPRPRTWLRSTFGERLAFYGGVSTQTVLPRGSPEEVREAVAACCTALAPECTGLLLAPSHRLMSDISMANVEALLAALAEAG